MLEECKSCEQKVRNITSHVNKLHRIDGTSPKTAEELNTAEGGVSNRWRTCAVAGCNKHCKGKIGLTTHNRHVHPALAANEEAAANNLAGAGAVAVGDLNDAAGVEQNEEVPVVNINYCFLLTITKKGLYNPHHSWLEIMRKLTTILLIQACDDSESISEKGAAALMLLPGIVQKVKDHGQKGLSPIALLRSIEAAENKAQYIIEQALHLGAISKPRGAHVENIPNIERARAETERLVQDGRIKLANKKVAEIHMLMSGIMPADKLSAEEKDAKIQSLFPRRDENDNLPDKENDPPIDTCLQINEHIMREKSYRMDTDACSGISAWTPRCIKKITDDRATIGYNVETQPGDIHRALALFFNKMLRGELSQKVRAIVTETRLVMIDKVLETGSRPIQVDCALIRYGLSAAKKDLDLVIGKAIGGIQLGAGVKNGPEILGRLCDRAFADGMTVTSLDSSNAYGEIGRLQAYNGLVEIYPPLVPYFRWKYGDDIIVRNNEGEIVATRVKGVGQGDPVAGFIYMVATHRQNLALEQGLRESEEEYRNQFGSDDIKVGKVAVLFDDAYIITDPKVTNINVPKIEPIYNQHGAKLNVSKSAITGRGAQEWGETPEGWKVNENGTKVVGIYIGRTTYRREKIKEKLRGLPPPVALSLMHPNTQMLLLAKSYSKTASYTINTARNFDDVNPEALIFDEAIAQNVVRIAALELTPTIRTIIQQPQKESGLGITQTANLEAEAGIMRGTKAFHKFIAEHYPQELQHTLNNYLNAEIILGSYSNRVEWTGMDTVTHESLTAENVGRVLARAKAKYYKNQRKELVSELGATGDTRIHAALLLSAAGSTVSTNFLYSTVGRNSENYFPRNAYVALLRKHLGGGLTNDEQPDRQCPCGQLCANAHSLSCSLNSDKRSKRHNLVCELLHRFMRTIKPGDRIEREEEVGQIVTPNERGGPDNVTHVQADIVWQNGTDKLVVDVHVVNAEAKEYLKHPNCSYEKQDAAALAGEARKRRYYGKVTVPHRIPTASVIPFVVESTGRLGPSAFSFLNMICGTQTYRRSKFLTELSLICARYSGFMLVATRDRLDTALQHGG